MADDPTGSRYFQPIKDFLFISSLQLSLKHEERDVIVSTGQEGTCEACLGVDDSVYPLVL